MTASSGALAVVTGAATGIGAAVVRRLADAGDRVLAVDVDAVALADAVSDLDSAVGVVADIGTPAGWTDVVDAVQVENLPVRVFDSNASVQRAAPLHELDLQEWNRQLQVNLTATFLGFRALHPYFADRSAVVLTSSVHALAGFPDHPGYAAAKGALLALTHQLAVQYGPRIRVNAVVPGPIRTVKWDGLSEDDLARSAAETVVGRLGTADEVAQVVAFLASDAASYVTGTSVVVDGGWSVKRDSA